MNGRRVFFLVGLAALAVGGGLLAFGGPRVGTVLGTTLGLAGVGLIGWAWAGRGRSGQ